MPNRNNGPERREHPDYLDDRVNQLERDLRAITHCLNGYKGFIETLKAREDQKIKLRQTLIEKGVGAALFSLASGAAWVIWYAANSWVRGH